MTHAFISYSRKDTEFVNTLENALHERGIHTWRDIHSIPGGARWFWRIKAGLESSYAMIFVDTPNAEASDWVAKEFLYAMDLKLPIISIKLDERFVNLMTIDLNPILCDEQYFATGMLRLDAQLRMLPQAPIKTGATPPPVEAPETAESEAAAFAAPVDAKEIHDYLDWLLVEAKADLRDALCVELAATPERIVTLRAKSALAFGLDDDRFTFSHVGLMIRKYGCA